MSVLPAAGETWVFGAVALLTITGAVLVPLVVRRRVPAHLRGLPSTASLRLAVVLAVGADVVTAVLALTRFVGGLTGAGDPGPGTLGWWLAGGLGLGAVAVLAVGIARIRREGAALHTASVPALSMLVARLGVVAVMVANLLYRVGVESLA